MASISTNKQNGHRTIYVTGPDKRRPPIRLGKCSKKQATVVLGFVEDLNRAKRTNSSPADKTLAWLKDIDPVLYERIAAVGLVEPRNDQTLGEFLDEYLAIREPSVKPFTYSRMKQSKRHALAHFGAEKPLRSITDADAQAYRAFLLNDQALAEATSRKHCGDARMWFNYAIKTGLVDHNPFMCVPVSVGGNKKRQAFISDEYAQKVLAELPTAELRLIFALARWGGLRIPSEPRELVWSDVGWDRRRLRVPSPKTEHHTGHECRTIPLFPEIEQALREVFEKAEDGSVHVLPFLQERSGASLRKPMLAAIQRAGLKVWPRLFHNLRASRQTELAAVRPAHVVSAWMGNTEQVAERHYLQVRDEDYEAVLNEEVVRKAVRAMATDHAHARHGYNEKAPSDAREGHCAVSPAKRETNKVPVTGFEPVLPCGNCHLKTARLPVPPHGRGDWVV